MGKVVFHIMPMDYPSKYDLSRGIPIDSFILREALEKLDYATEDAGLTALFCSSEATIHEVLQRRDGIKRELLGIIEEILTEWLEQLDTEMGYPLTERREKNA